MRVRGTALVGLAVVATAAAAFLPATGTDGSSAAPRPAQAPQPAQAVPAPVRTTVFDGYGAWVDRYDYATGRQIVTPATIDVMARAGVQVLFLQGATPAGGTLLAPKRQRALIARAKRHGMRVVAWYLPTTKPISADLRRLRAMNRLKGVDAIGLDAESRAVGRVSTRTARLLSLIKQTNALTDKPIGLITPSPTAMARWSTTFWPGYPFAAAAPYVDAYLPMTYWAWHRKQTTARGQITGDVNRLRAIPEVAGKPIHVIGMTTWKSDARTFAALSRELELAGGSLYDWLTTPQALRKPLRGLRR
ncbi:hypothetical protein ACIB24_08860 [Spongisporangium articulatum]|uniref:Glycosyl hydrolases family 25 n=1 Tax=Spongisporangium articulatum TaxID=3362603 RepID=A0ABW8ALC5_9ACTN